MRKIDWKGICELIAVLCTGMGLGMEICIHFHTGFYDFIDGFSTEG